MPDYVYSAEARADLIGIWEHIAQDNLDAADLVEREFQGAIQKLAGNPRLGHLQKILRRKTFCSGAFIHI